MAALICAFTFFLCGNNSEADYPVVEITTSLSEAVKNYSEVSEFHNGLAVVYDGRKYGFIDTLGNEVVPCTYDRPHYEEPGFYSTTSYDTSGNLITLDGKEITLAKEIEYIRDLDLIFCRRLSGGEFYNLKGEEVDPGIFSKTALQNAAAHGELFECTPFFNGLALAAFYDRPNRTWYKKMIDTNGNTVMSITEKDGKYGVVDANGKEVVPHKFKAIHSYDSGYLLVEDGVSRYGLWDLKAGKMQIEPIYNIRTESEPLIHSFIKDGFFITSQANGKALRKVSDGSVVIGEEIGAKGFDILPNGYIRVSFDNGFLYDYAIYDKEGNEIVGRCTFVTPGPQGFVAKYEGQDDNGEYWKKVGVFDLKGKKIIEAEHYSCGVPSEGLIAVKHEENGKFGFVNMKGKYVIEPKYDRAGYFSDGLAPVMIAGKWGYVNRKGEDTFDSSSSDY